ncbi:MAG TPA: polymer-forming cytoskeletal protein [Phototrophicaceae bacterium]|nr:polymer-forming cytoskeletal protein [Phototrophicaceae bacterium]
MGIFGNRRSPQAEPEPQEIPERTPQHPPQSTSMPSQPIGFETVLGASSSLEGKFTSSSNVRLDGTFTGTLEINGNVLVGETARINADIHAKNISIAGAVRGNVTGKKVQLLRTGRVWGDITATALTTEEGAFIDGRIAMVSQEVAVKVPEPVAAPASMTPSSAPVNPEPADEVDEEPDFLVSSDDTETISSSESEA